MLPRELFFLFLLIKASTTCIPTQQTCSTCAPFYDTTCPGTASYGCATDSEASVSYSLSGSTCSSSFSCPGVTSIMYDTAVGYSLPPAGTTATCSEADGIWYFDNSGVNTETSRFRCM
ncbi:hypothetical protein CAEBREN_25224 [Caenorhabditis brenneri]|uniref:C6 domain-containing protein n=1 Tax=Caenorhabditis brenneri TaxID=135651 RepID=G0MPT2_CAEBE|nr:hypothetical protein CAEBREN_25224 [Caenorhabditis brenneri]